MNRYKVSVITPMYKVENYIGKCCRSLFSQSIADVEFIFVDDKTPDKSLEVLNKLIEEFPDRREHIKIISHKQNLGVACARNTGLENATGEYIMFVDADDWLEPDAIADIYGVACCGSYDIVGYDWYLEFETNRRYLKQPEYCDIRECFRAMLSGELRWYLWAFMVRRSLYTEHGFKFISGLNVGEDMMMLLKLFSVARSYRHIQSALYHYIQQNKSSITQLDAQKQLAVVERNAVEVVKYIRDRFGNSYNRELNYMMLNIKFPLLISGDNSNYDLWNKTFTEANGSVWQNRRISFRSKFLQWMAMNRQYWFLRLYYKFIFKFIYGVLYK